MRYSIGCDPELFVRNKTTGKFISAHSLIPGTKQLPHSVKYGAVQRDGVAAEFNIQPALSLDAFSRNIFETYNELLRMVKNRSKDYELVATPTATFEGEYFKHAVPPHAKLLGCDPDFDAYSGITNDKPVTKEPVRTGAGHIHVGWAKEGQSFNPDEEHVWKCREMVKQLDAALYVPSLLWDNDDKRRTLYGKIGAFRPKPYGFEYRPLSNAWVLEPDLHKFIFNTVQLALANYDKGIFYFDVPDYEENIKAIRRGHNLSVEEVYDHYWDLAINSMIERLPSRWASQG